MHVEHTNVSDCKIREAPLPLILPYNNISVIAYLDLRTTAHYCEALTVGFKTFKEEKDIRNLTMPLYGTRLFLQCTDKCC